MSTQPSPRVYDELWDFFRARVRVRSGRHRFTHPCVILDIESSTIGAGAMLTVEQAKRLRDALDAFITEAT